MVAVLVPVQALLFLLFREPTLRAMLERLLAAVSVARAVVEIVVATVAAAAVMVAVLPQAQRLRPEQTRMQQPQMTAGMTPQGQLPVQQAIVAAGSRR